MDSNQLLMLNMFFCILAIGFILSFILYGMFDTFIRRIIRKFSKLQKIKTENGYLYLSRTGVYTTKDRCFELDQEWKLKHRDRWIRHHERVLNRLKNSG